MRGHLRAYHVCLASALCLAIALLAGACGADIEQQSASNEEPAADTRLVTLSAGLSTPVTVAGINVQWGGQGRKRLSTANQCTYKGVPYDDSTWPATNCALSPWGNGTGYLAKLIKDNVADSIALVVNEAWDDRLGNCALVGNIKTALGWGTSAAHYGADNPLNDPSDPAYTRGIGIIARYGFTGACSKKELVRCGQTRYVVHCPVRVASGSTETLHVFGTHWKEQPECTDADMRANATDTRNFVALKAPDPAPKVILGDFNVIPGHVAYNDMNVDFDEIGTGNTAWWDNDPLERRIDYAWFRNATGSTFRRFNHGGIDQGGADGDCKATDHAGVKVTLEDATATADLPAAIDSWIDERPDFVNTNNATATTVWVDGDPGAQSRSLFRFDVSSLAGKTVVGVKFKYFVTNLTGNFRKVYTLKKPWTEGGVTWNKYDSTTNWEVPGAAGTTDRGAFLGDLDAGGTVNTYRTVSLNSAAVTLVQNWINGTVRNDGFIAVSNSTAETDGLGISSRETANRPILVVTYR
jgi:hypothetical protein